MQPRLTPGLRRFLLFTAATTGAVIMIVEILGAKMLAPYIGTSHFVWTAQIGVTLMALATGYALGGKLADRAPQFRWLYGALLLAALALSLSVLWCEPVAFACLRFKLAVGSLLAATTLFFVPLALLAIVPPFLVRALTTSLATVGTSMGRLSAISTAGSMIGTLLIGYALIPFLPNSIIMYAVAGLLALLAVAYFAIWESKRLAPAVALALAGLATGFIGIARPTLDPATGAVERFRGNSNFGLLQVIDDERTGWRYYANDLLTQNTYLPAERQSASLFTHMLHGLARIYTPEIHDVLCIGLGVGVVPMQFARAGARVDVVEINDAVVPLARKFFDLDPARLNLIIGDGRQFVATTTNRYDTIILDAFLGESPPSHLMTREALAAMKARLKPGGTLVMNTFGEFTPGRDYFLASLAQTLQVVFPNVRIHAMGNGNVFFVATTRPELQFLREPDFAGVPRFLQARVAAAYEDVRTTDAAQGRVLTDDFNPVDFHDAANREELRRRLALASQH